MPKFSDGHHDLSGHDRCGYRDRPIYVGLAAALDHVFHSDWNRDGPCLSRILSQVLCDSSIHTSVQHQRLQYGIHPKLVAVKGLARRFNRDSKVI